MAKKKDGMLEQYDTLARTTSDVTAWRQGTNQFYLACASSLLGLTAYIKDGSALSSAVLCLLGMLLTRVWWENIQSYKQLNSAKFKVLLDIEKKLAYPAFAKEREIYKSENRQQFTSIEKHVPTLFLIAFLFMFLLIVWAPALAFVKIILP
ncbi:MAG: hypothetical protein V1728_02995 [Candidatus Micrarchaeota archaeon]